MRWVEHYIDHAEQAKKFVVIAKRHELDTRHYVGEGLRPALCDVRAQSGRMVNQCQDSVRVAPQNLSDQSVEIRMQLEQCLRTEINVGSRREAELAAVGCSNR